MLEQQCILSHAGTLMVLLAVGRNVLASCVAAQPVLRSAAVSRLPQKGPKNPGAGEFVRREGCVT